MSAWAIAGIVIAAYTVVAVPAAVWLGRAIKAGRLIHDVYDPVPYVPALEPRDEWADGDAGLAHADAACALTQPAHTEDDPDLIRWNRQPGWWFDELATRRARRGQ